MIISDPFAGSLVSPARPFGDAENLPDERIRNRRDMIGPQELARIPTVFPKRLRLHQLGTSLEDGANLGCHLCRHHGPVDDPRLLQSLGAPHSNK
jgi:hypothetical protein